MIDPRTLTNKTLESYDTMMMRIAARCGAIPELAMQIWSCVLVELNIRGRVQLMRGSYDNVRDAEIRRIYLNCS